MILCNECCVVVLCVLCVAGLSRLRLSYRLKPNGWSISGGCMSSRSARCSSCKRGRGRTRAVRPATCSHRSTPRASCRYRSRRARRRRPRTCSTATLRRDRRRTSPPNPPRRQPGRAAASSGLRATAHAQCPTSVTPDAKSDNV